MRSYGSNDGALHYRVVHEMLPGLCYCTWLFAPSPLWPTRGTGIAFSFESLLSSLLYYVLHQSQLEGWFAIEDHEDRGHCQRDTGRRKSHSLVSKLPSLFGVVQRTYTSEHSTSNHKIRGWEIL